MTCAAPTSGGAGLRARANPSGSRATIRRVQGGRHSGAQADEVTICAKSNSTRRAGKSSTTHTSHADGIAVGDQVARSSINPTLVAPRDHLVLPSLTPLRGAVSACRRADGERSRRYYRPGGARVALGRSLTEGRIACAGDP